MLKQDSPITPWYKQFWPWFLIFLPMSAVVAGITTFIIAQNNQPTLVSDNHYKEGLAINVDKKLQQNASKLGITHTTIIGQSTLSIHLTGDNASLEFIQVNLRHATISQHDSSLKLIRISHNVYQAPYVLPIEGKWYIRIHDPLITWEISLSEHLSSP